MLSYNTAPADLERQLSAGETLIWNGRPKQGLMLRPSDALLIPFSLLWGGFALFWEAGVVADGAPFFFMLWGIPFLIVAAYITVGRFFVDAYIRAKTSYGVTNERVLIIAGLFSRTVKTLPLQTLSEISLRQYADGSGTITFGPEMPSASWYRGFAWPGMEQRLTPAFERIPEAKQVYELVRKAQRPG
jgi:hypothetical protein